MEGGGMEVTGCSVGPAGTTGGGCSGGTAISLGRLSGDGSEESMLTVCMPVSWDDSTWARASEPCSSSHICSVSSCHGYKAAR